MSSVTSDNSGDSIGRLAELIGRNPADRLDADIRHVLDVLEELGARPLELSTPERARRMPDPADAIRAIAARQQRDLSEDGVSTEDVEFTSGESALPARLYRPPGLLSRLNPVLLYFHGGGFVTGDLDSHDASARALARRTGALVVSAGYRLAPEHPFPAAHEDALAAWRWLSREVHALGGDPRRIAIAGEDAGANLAMNVALSARDGYGVRPVHMLLIHPIAGHDFSTPSYGEALRARPIGMAAMRWRFRHLAPNAAELDDPRIDLADRGDLAGLPSTTIVLAQVDPLRSEGEALAEALSTAGVKTECQVYEGMAQGFFGLGQLVTRALFAQADAAGALYRAFTTARA